MADEILRSKHAFGEFANLDKAIADGKIDAYDILFLDGKTEPKIGWVDKDGNVVILEDKKQVMAVDSLPETGNEDTIYICGSTFYFWNGSEFVASADNVGVSEDLVNARFDDAVSEANAYTDEKIAEVSSGFDLAELAGRVTQAETDIDNIEKDYLKAADKTELEGKITTAQGAADKVAEDLAGAVKRIAKNEGDIAANKSAIAAFSPIATAGIDKLFE